MPGSDLCRRLQQVSPILSKSPVARSHITRFSDCYCADSEPVMSMMTSTQCNMPCPGNAIEHCGGTRVVSRYQRRQTARSDMLLTVYINPNNPGAVDLAPAPNLDVDPPAIKDTGDTATSTVAEDAGFTSSVFVPDAPTVTEGAAVPAAVIVGAAPALPTTESVVLPSEGVSSVSTATNSQDVSISISTASPSAPTVHPSGETTASCVSSYCYSTYALEAYDTLPSSGEAVFVPKQDNTSGSWSYEPVAYDNALYSKITVYRPVPCTGNSPVDSVAYQPQACDQCFGGVVFVQAPSQTLTRPGPLATVSASTLTVSTPDYPPEGSPSISPSSHLSNVVTSSSARKSLASLWGLAFAVLVASIQAVFAI